MPSSVPTTDYITAAYQKIWALLLASGDFTYLVLALNRVRYDQGQLIPQRQGAKSPADLPEVTIDLGTFTDDGYTGVVTLGNVRGTDCVRVELFTQTFVVYVLVDTLDIVKADQVRTAIKAALSAGGRNLGLDYVVKWGPFNGEYKQITKGSGAPGQPAGTTRRQIRMNVPVSFRVETD